MFADDAEVVFGDRVFRNRDQELDRLYLEVFASGRIGKRMEPAPGFEVDTDRQADSVEVAADRLTASAVFPYSIQVGMPLAAESSLVAMARLHGEGVQTWWEGGAYHVTYGRAGVDTAWKIRKLAYRTLSRADYRAGRSDAKPLAVSPLSASWRK